ncbi:hypothetical protein [Pelodictyon phaeoclathratiforme]|nr:hypothetical protein [Pelodictyon phaeoclathratiforme]MBV5289721.1 hypothetical protein [Pelodictyon phaeoclathratiforme]
MNMQDGREGVLSLRSADEEGRAGGVMDTGECSRGLTGGEICRIES